MKNRYFVGYEIFAVSIPVFSQIGSQFDHKLLSSNFGWSLYHKELSKTLLRLMVRNEREKDYFRRIRLSLARLYRTFKSSRARLPLRDALFPTLTRTFSKRQKSYWLKRVDNPNLLKNSHGGVRKAKFTTFEKTMQRYEYYGSNHLNLNLNLIGLPSHLAISLNSPFPALFLLIFFFSLISPSLCYKIILWFSLE